MRKLASWRVIWIVQFKCWSGGVLQWCSSQIHLRCRNVGRRIAQTDLDIQGSHAHHACTLSSCAWTMNGEVYGETITHNNVKRCLHKWILIALAIKAAMLEDSMTSHETLYFLTKFCWNICICTAYLPGKNLVNLLRATFFSLGCDMLLIIKSYVNVKAIWQKCRWFWVQMIAVLLLPGH